MDHSEGRTGAARRVAALIQMMNEAYLMEASRRLILVRHGEADRIGAGDRYDPGLSPRGRAQAKAAAKRIAAAVAGDIAVFTSPLRRALETARIIAEPAKLSPVVEPGLAEVGRDQVPVPLRLPEVSGKVARFSWQSPDGPFRGTAAAGIETVLARSDAHTTVAVTHGGVINAYVAHTLGMDCDFFFNADHTSLTVFRVAGTRVALDRLNDTNHLESARCDRAEARRASL